MEADDANEDVDVGESRPVALGIPDKRLDVDTLLRGLTEERREVAIPVLLAEETSRALFSLLAA